MLDAADIRKMVSSIDQEYDDFLEDQSPTEIEDLKSVTNSLRACHSKAFCARVRSKLPIFNQQARDIMQCKEKKLSQLGLPRGNAREQRIYLKALAKDYQYHKSPNNPFYLWAVEKQSTMIHCRLTKMGIALKYYLKESGPRYPFRTPYTISIKASPQFGVPDNDIFTWIDSHYQKRKYSTIPGQVPIGLIERLFKEQTQHWKSTTLSLLKDLEGESSSTVTIWAEMASKELPIPPNLVSRIKSEINMRVLESQKRCVHLINNEHKRLHIIASEEGFMEEIKEARTERIIDVLVDLEVVEKAKTSPSQVSSTSTAFGRSPQSASASLFTQTDKTTSSSVNLFGVRKPAHNPFGKPNPLHDPGASFSTVIAIQKRSGLFSSGIFSTNASKESKGQLKTGFDLARNHKNKLKEELSSDRRVVLEIHDILKAYYNSAFQHYTDTVCDHYLNKSFVEGIINVFSEEFVDKLSKTELNEIAGETNEERQCRRELKKDIRELECILIQSEALLEASNAS